MSEFCYVYVLRSRVDGHFYVGLTHDLRRRFEEHQAERGRFLVLITRLHDHRVPRQRTKPSNDNRNQLITW